MLSSHCALRRLTIPHAQYTTQIALGVCGSSLRSRTPMPDRRLLSFSTDHRHTSEFAQKRLRRRSISRTLAQITAKSYASGQTNMKRKEEEEDVPPVSVTESSHAPTPRVETATPSTTSLVRPEISPSIVPFLPPSALDSPHPHAPPVATSAVREAIADYLEAERSGHVLAPGPEITSKWRILYFRAKQLFKFYWAGLKLLRTNFMDMRSLQKGRKSEG